MNRHGHSNSARPIFLLFAARRRWVRYRIADQLQSNDPNGSDAKAMSLALKSVRLSLSATSLAPNRRTHHLRALKQAFARLSNAFQALAISPPWLKRGFYCGGFRMTPTTPSKPIKRLNLLLPIHEPSR
jgi:hypothetical protein